jgi:hypothetical protein
VLLHHALAAQVNPTGGEHHLLLSLCVPLIRKPGPLFDLTNAEVGVANYISPSYIHGGGFLSLAPLSILQLRTEVTGVYVWTLPQDGTGYHTFQSYDDDYSEDALPEENAQTAGGFVFSGSATLRGRIGKDGGVALLMSDTFLAERWSLGDGPYYLNLRRDIILESTDWVLKNSAALLVEIPISKNVATRLGAVDETTVSPVSGRTTNITAGLASIVIRRIGGTIRDLQPFVRVGAYTHHASSSGFRTHEPNALLGISTTYELAVLGL